MHLLSIYTRWLFILFVSLCLSQTVTAHEIKPAIIDLNFISAINDRNKKELVVEIVVNLESLMAGIDLDHNETGDSENSNVYQTMRAMDEANLLEEFDQFERYFLDSLFITDADQSPIILQVRSIVIPPVGDISNPRDTTIILGAALPLEVISARFKWADEFGEVIIRANSDVEILDYAALLSPGQHSALIQFTQRTSESVSKIFTNYILVGFEHILPKGLDHILFVIGLFLLSPAWRPLALQITTFTIAHSITLALGATDVLRAPVSIVEPLIAASIVIVCAENFLSQKLNKWRIALVFVFGLLHGLGFASVLDAIGLDSSHTIIALLGFNVGVELGQLLIIATCWLCIGLWIGQKTWYRAFFSKPISAAIGLVGAFWFFQRIISL